MISKEKFCQILPENAFKIPYITSTDEIWEYDIIRGSDAVCEEDFMFVFGNSERGEFTPKKTARLTILSEEITPETIISDFIVHCDSESENEEIKFLNDAVREICTKIYNSNNQ
ncbi:hypothetical protein [Methanococcus maripaludis]|uniref:Uncharacterized protein n=1 Tax=Methanococcus maripaludis OS7 TaxID=637915 RepID=A0A2Z5PIV0_METMI|nr:hypothetical protein [Methanococcus maripaludis]BAP62913.1 hypothetical protein MMOS7_08270 [Methanococcus maripaludis OS7]